MKNIFIYTFLSVLIFYIFIFQKDTEKLNIEDYSAIPNVIATSIVITQFQENGKINYQLHSDRAEFFMQTRQTFLQEPYIQFFTQDNPTPWIVKANRGEVFEKEKIKLIDKVNITGRPKTDYSKTTITTKMLDIDLEKNLITTDEDIDLSSIEYSMQATGLKADINTSIIEVLDNVVATYRMLNVQ